MELKHQQKSTPLSRALSLSFSPGVPCPLALSVPPSRLSLHSSHRCLHSILLNQFGPVLFSLPCLYSFALFVFASRASPLSSVLLVLYTMHSSHHSILYLSFIYFFFLSSLSVSPSFSPLHFPPSLVSFPPPLHPHPSFDSLHNPPLQSLLVSAPVVEG